MAKSRRIRPEDSTPDFGRLAELDQGSDEDSWTPEETDDTVRTDPPGSATSASEDRSSSSKSSNKSSDVPKQKSDRQPSASPRPAGSQSGPPVRSDRSAAAAPASKVDPADDAGHVFFDIHDDLGEDELAGETAYMAPRQLEEIQNAAADKSDEVGTGRESTTSHPKADPPAESTALTQEGIPNFAAMPAPDPAADQTLIEMPQIETETLLLPDDRALASEDPEFPTPGPDDETVPLPEDEDPAPSMPRPDDDTVPLIDVPQEEVDSLGFPVVDAAHRSPPSGEVDSSSTAPAPGDTPADPIAASPASKKSPTPPRAPDSRQSEKPVASRSTAGSPAGGGKTDRPRLAWIFLASYASVVTLLCLWLWANRGAARPHDLESLPDVAPLDANEFRYAPQNASMPAGHTLPLGTSAQLGYVKVEPLRVTRGPVRFTHYANAAESRTPTEPVLKLWLRFTNVSSDQLIAPLDAALLLTRDYDVTSDTILANQLVQPAEKNMGQSPAYVIDHPISSEWDLADQQLGKRLKPGESLETYIPLDPATPALTGDLLWRVHFRKGYHDPSGHGVTTMIEVPFHRDVVQAEAG